MPVSASNLMASIGSIFLLWSSVERSLAQSISELEGEQTGKSALTISQKIALWVELQKAVCAERTEHEDLLRQVWERLNAALQVRNRIAHGLTGYVSDPSGQSGNAHLKIEMNGAKHELSYQEIQETNRRLSHLDSAIEALSRAAREKDTRAAESAYMGIRLNHLP